MVFQRLLKCLRRTGPAEIEIPMESTPCAAPIQPVPSFATMDEEALYVQSLIEKMDSAGAPLHALPFLREIQAIATQSSQPEIYVPNIGEELLGIKIYSSLAEIRQRIIRTGQGNRLPTLEDSIRASVRGIERKEAKGMIDGERTVNYALREATIETMQNLAKWSADHKDTILKVNMPLVVHDYERAKQQYEQLGYSEPLEMQVKQNNKTIWRTADRVIYRCAVMYYRDLFRTISVQDLLRKDINTFELNFPQHLELMQTYAPRCEYNDTEKEAFDDFVERIPTIVQEKVQEARRLKGLVNHYSLIERKRESLLPAESRDGGMLPGGEGREMQIAIVRES